MVVHYREAFFILHHDSAIPALATMPSECVNTVVTSPPYWGLRDYGVDGQLGMESTPDKYVAALVGVFRSVRRVLRSDGTVWLNLGDCYAGAKPPCGLKRKDMLGMPWRVAFALQEDGWYLRSDIIWYKRNAMPETVRDRPTKAHEYLFLLAKSEKYYYDFEAIKEPAEWERWGGQKPGKYQGTDGLGSIVQSRTKAEIHKAWKGKGKNKRTVWDVPTKPYSGAHFACFPPKLIEPAILAGAPEGGVVLDPFAGSGTTGMVAKHLGRAFIGVEINAKYCDMAVRRMCDAE